MEWRACGKAETSHDIGQPIPDPQRAADDPVVPIDQPPFFPGFQRIDRIDLQYPDPPVAKAHEKGFRSVDAADAVVDEVYRNSLVLLAQQHIPQHVSDFIVPDDECFEMDIVPGIRYGLEHGVVRADLVDQNGRLVVLYQGGRADEFHDGGVPFENSRRLDPSLDPGEDIPALRGRQASICAHDLRRWPGGG